jgi:hypothetical protein
MAKLNDITRRQHYVWQKYLEPWKKDEKVWVYREGSIFNPSTKNVLLEKDMYKVYTLNNTEKKYLDLIMMDYRKDVDKIVLEEMSFLDLLGYLDKINPGVLLYFFQDKLGLEVRHRGQKLDLSSIIKDLIVNNPPKLKEQIIELTDKFRIQHGEDLMSLNENAGSKYMEKLLSSDISFFDNNNPDLLEFYIFLMSQLLRTSKMRRGLSNALNERKNEFQKAVGSSEDIEGYKVFSHMVHGLITKSSIGLYSDKNMRISLFESKGLHFLTSDQPVFNINSDFDENGMHKSMDIFMPISPSKAILVSPKLEENKVLEICDSEVNRYNELIIKNSHNLIVSDTRHILENIASR